MLIEKLIQILRTHMIKHTLITSLLEDQTLHNAHLESHTAESAMQAGEGGFELALYKVGNM